MKYSKNVSMQPRKKRKAMYNAPLHAARKYLHSPLSKELRKKEGTRAMLVRTGDKVKVMRGEHAGKTAKVVEVDYKTRKVYLEGIAVQGRKTKKQSYIPLDSSKLLITELSERKAGKAQGAAKQAPAAKKQ